MRELTAKQLGERIALLREEHKMSLGDLADEAELAKSYLSRIEKGEIENPGLKTLSAIARALRTTVRDILTLGSGAKGGGASPSAVAFQTITDSMPDALREFVDDQEKKGKPVPADTVRALAVLKFRGKRPETADDYQLLYEMLQRVV